jgi:hypothetical protein
MTMSSSRHSNKSRGPREIADFVGFEEDIPEIPLDLGISLEREELGEDSGE